MIAEATGVFIYVYVGVAAQATFFLNGTEPQYGSLLQIGLSYCFGIVFAIIVCGSTSGGHFNPAVTFALALYGGFPWLKVPYYIFSQVFGSFMAALLIVGQYWPQLHALDLKLQAAGVSSNSLGGPGSVLVSIPAATQTNLGYVFLVEFFVDTFIALVIWSVLDPANPFISAAAAPWVIGFGYGTMIWGFADLTIATNMARDLGTRIVAAIFYGSDAFGKYSAIAILTGFPATVLAAGFYELAFRDSFAIIAKGHGEHEGGQEGLVSHLTKTGTLEGYKGGEEMGMSNGNEVANGDKELV